MSEQGIHPMKVQEAIKKLGYPPKEADILKIKEAVKGAAPATNVVVEPSPEQKQNLRVQELVTRHSRRDLEQMLRDLGIEPTKQEYPDMLSLAKKIAELEAQKEAPA